MASVRRPARGSGYRSRGRPMRREGNQKELHPERSSERPEAPREVHFEEWWEVQESSPVHSAG